MISIKNLNYGFGAKKVLENINLDIRENEVLLITGSNGAGKTTLLRIMAGVLFPYPGTFQYGLALGKQPMSRIGFISDQISLYQSMSLQEAIDFHSQLYQVKDFDTTILKEAKLDLKKKISDHSVGQKLIFHLSLVLSTRPKLLLLDEVLHAIDPYLRELCLKRILNLLTQGETTLVMVNLNFHDIENIPQRVIIIRENTIALDQPLEILKDKVKKIVSKAEMPELHAFHERFFADRHEYYVYPFEESMVKDPRCEVLDLNLNDIVTAFIGGEYA